MDPKTVVPKVLDAVSDAADHWRGEPGQADALAALVQEAASTLTVRSAMESSPDGAERLARALVRGSTAILILAVHYAALAEELKEKGK